MSGRDTDRNELGAFLRPTRACGPCIPTGKDSPGAVVSYMRMEAARKPDDPRLAELVGDLRFS